MASIGPIITIIGSILLVLLKQWQDEQPARKEEDRVQEIQKGRVDISGGNADLVSERLDRVLTLQAESAPGSDAGSAGGAGQARGAVTADRLGAFGISVGEAPGGR